MSGMRDVRVLERRGDAKTRLNAEVERLEKFPLDEVSHASLDRDLARDLAIYQVQDPVHEDELENRGYRRTAYCG